MATIYYKKNPLKAGTIYTANSSYKEPEEQEEENDDISIPKKKVGRPSKTINYEQKD